MIRSIHGQARELIAQGGSEEISDAEQTWLRDHLHDCGACREYAEAVARAVQALRSQPLAADSALVRATQRRVRSRAVAVRQQRERIWLVGLSCLLVGTSTAVTTPIFWQAFEWVGLWAGVSHWVSQASFTFFWMAPALVVSALLLAHGTHLANDRER